MPAWRRPITCRRRSSCAAAGSWRMSTCFMPLIWADPTCPQEDPSRINKWCIRQVVWGFSVLGTLRQGWVLLGSTAMTLRVRALDDDEADELVRMARSRTLG